MPKLPQLSFEDYIVSTPGKPGYNPLSVRQGYYSPSTGKTLSVRQFQQQAHGNIPYEVRVPADQRKSYVKTGTYTHPKTGKTITWYKSRNLSSLKKKITQQDLMERTKIYSKGYGRSRKSGYKTDSKGNSYSTLATQSNVRTFLTGGRDDEMEEEKDKIYHDDDNFRYIIETVE